MKNVYAYLCDTHKCDNCSFPECSHTLDENHRIHGTEETEMRLVYSSDDTNYYMEYVKRGTKKFKIYFYENGDHDGIESTAKTMIVYAKSRDEVERKFKYMCISCRYTHKYTLGWIEECDLKGE